MPHFSRFSMIDAAGVYLLTMKQAGVFDFCVFSRHIELRRREVQARKSGPVFYYGLPILYGVFS